MPKRTVPFGIPEYFRRRYGKGSGLITAIIMFIPLIGLTAGQFIASSVILSTMLGINYQVAANVPAETMGLFSGYSLFDIISLVIMYVATFSVGQEAVSRFYAAKDGKSAKGGAWIAAVINFIYAFIPTILGIIVLALINMGKFNAADFESVGARYALPVLAMEVMPAIICGLLFSGIISATMSSSDSDLLGAGSIFANDIYKAAIKPSASDEEVMKVTKIMMCLVGVASMFIALFNTQSLITILMFCFTLRAAGTFFPYVVGHYWGKASTAGTIASLIAGTIVVYLDKFSGGNLFGIHFSQTIVPGLVAALIAFLVFSAIFPNKKNSTELSAEE